MRRTLFGACVPVAEVPQIRDRARAGVQELNHRRGIRKEVERKMRRRNSRRHSTR